MIKKLDTTQGLKVIDDVKSNLYPLACNCSGFDDVFIGRIRRDYSVKYGLNFWVVADNIRKGAATNAIQILEKMINKKAE